MFNRDRKPKPNIDLDALHIRIALAQQRELMHGAVKRGDMGMASLHEASVSALERELAAQRRKVTANGERGA